jgi:hypothetical protein
MGGGIDDVQRGISVAPTGLDSGQAYLVMVQRMERIYGNERPYLLSMLAEDLHESSRRGGRGGARAMMQQRQFRDEDERLGYLRYVVELELGGELFQHGGWRILNGPGRDAVVRAMVSSETERMKAIAATAVPYDEGEGLGQGGPAMTLLDPRGLSSAWGQRAAAEQRSEFENYLLEVALYEDQQQEERSKPMVYSGAATVDLYHQYVGAGVAGIVKVVKDEAPGLVSLALDFVPIVGQIKGVAEAILGQDLITGRQLADWERGLNILLSVLPSARGVFKAGKAGLRTLARVAVETGKDASDVYRVAKGASKLADDEVKAAKQLLANGKPANPTQFEKVAGTLEDMAGTVKKPKAKQSYRVAAGLIQDNRALGRSVASTPTALPKVPVGKVIVPVKTAAAVSQRLIKNGITAQAIEALERVGVQVTDKVADALIKSKAGGFVNVFHKSSGFELVVKDLLSAAKKKKGAELVIEFVMDAANKIDPRLAKFELPVGITRKARGPEVASRLTDLVVTQGGRTLNYEFKAYSKASLAFWARKDPIQMAKDLSMLGRQTMKWVFDSREVSRSYVYKKLKQAIRADALLAKEFGTGAKLEKALDDLVVMYPPVPKPPPPPGLHGFVNPTPGDDE